MKQFLLKDAGNLQTLNRSDLEVSLGKTRSLERESRETGERNNKRSRDSRSGDRNFRSKRLRSLIAPGSCGCGWPHEGQSLSLHRLQGEPALSNVPRGTSSGEHNYFGSQREGFGSRSSTTRIYSQPRNFLRSQSRTRECVLPRITSLDWFRWRNRGSATERISQSHPFTYRGCKEGGSNSRRFGYSNRDIILARSSEWNSYLLAQDRSHASGSNRGRDCRVSLQFNLDSRVKQAHLGRKEKKYLNSLNVERLSDISNSRHSTGDSA